VVSQSNLPREKLKKGEYDIDEKQGYFYERVLFMGVLPMIRSKK